MRRHTAAVLGILLVTGLTACGDASERSEPSDPPTDLTRVGPGHGTLAEARVVDAHADDVLVSVYSTGGSGDPGTHVPDVEVRTDGTVYLNGEDGLGVDTFGLTSDGLARVREAFEHVAFGKYDYEESEWTDQPTTSIYTTIGGRPEATSVYGLGHDDEVEDFDWDRLLEAIADLDDLAEIAATSTDPDIATRRASYRPQRVALVLEAADDADDAIDWPLMRPLTRLDQGSTEYDVPCVVATGRDVVTLEALRDQGLDERPWTSGTTTVDVDVRPILPGVDGPCSAAS